MIDYKKTLISQYANSPRIIKLLEDFNYNVDPSDDIENILSDILNIDTAQGFGLDIIGRIVGVDRFVKLPPYNSYFGFYTPPDVSFHFIACSGGDFHSLALKSDGSVIAWGRNHYGQSTIPSGAATGVVAIAAGRSHSLALKSDGSVIGWGANFLGQTTIPSGAATGVVAIAAGGSHSLALKSDGSVIGWGSNSDGQAESQTP